MISGGEPTPLADGTIDEVRGKLPVSEGKHFNARFDACCVTEKALRLGLLISPTEYEGQIEAETRLIGVLQAYRQHLEKHVEPLVLADLLENTPRHSAGHRHATHQRRLEIFMKRQCRCERVCECGRYYCMDSKKVMEFYRNQQSDHTLVSTTAIPLSEEIIHEIGGNILLLEGKDMISGSERTALPDQGITKKVEERLSLSSEGKDTVSVEEESFERELADAKVENAKLREALKKKKER